jgi:hypothetical protein
MKPDTRELDKVVVPSLSPITGVVQPNAALRGPIQFRFVLQFAPQLSTPCSRGLGIKPRAGNPLQRAAPRMFQSYLQRHSVLQ